MKNLIISLSIGLILAACAAIPVATSELPKEQQKPNWVHVFDKENRIAASVDTNDGSVKYFQSEDAAFKALFAALLNMKKQEQAAVDAAKKTVETPKKK